MSKESDFSSSSNKLLKHCNILNNVKQGYFNPVTLQLSPTNVCNLNCEFCSVKNRDKKIELSLVTCKKIINNFIIHGGIKAVEITGGGDPTCYPYIEELIDYCHNRSLEIGLITNGLLLKQNIKTRILNKLTWIRISLSALDFGLSVDVPEYKGVLGFSYVWHEKSKPQVLDLIYDYGKRHNSEYIRIVPNCLDITTQGKLIKDVNKLVFDKGYFDLMFVQSKSYAVYRPCRIGGLKPFVYTDGYVYHCSANPLYAKDFGEDWRICHWKDIDKVWPDKFKPYHAMNCVEGKCFYSDQNKLLDLICREVEHEKFI